MNTTIAVLVVLGLLALPVQGQRSDAKGTRESAKEVIADSVITARIKSEFAKDKEVSALNVKTDTDDKGVVTLNGTAKRQAEADKAVKIARETKGVSTVKNEIRVQTR